MYDSESSNPESQPPEESSNRTFLIAAGILGGIVLLSIACFAAYALFILPGQRTSQQQTLNANATQNAVVAFALTATQQAASLPTETVTPSQTPVVAQASSTPTPATNTPDPATATVAAALTLAAQAQLTHVPTSTALPGTGIGDQFGSGTGLVIMGVVLIAVIFLARRLRVVPTK